MLDLPEAKIKILNVGLLGLAFMLAFTAFNVSFSYIKKDPIIHKNLSV